VPSHGRHGSGSHETIAAEKDKSQVSKGVSAARVSVGGVVDTQGTDELPGRPVLPADASGPVVATHQLLVGEEIQERMACQATHPLEVTIQICL